MATSSTYYLNARTLAEATSVYTNSSLTTLAPNQWYSDGAISRQQIGGVLSTAANCSCPTAPEQLISVATSILNNGHTSGLTVTRLQLIVPGYVQTDPDNLNITISSGTTSGFGENKIYTESDSLVQSPDVAVDVSKIILRVYLFGDLTSTTTGTWSTTSSTNIKTSPLVTGSPKLVTEGTVNLTVLDVTFQTVVSASRVAPENQFEISGTLTINYNPL